MQTFLPEATATMCAARLDAKRLNKQIVEVKQIYLALTLPTYGWQNHPAVRMWEGHRGSLLVYGMVLCEEALSRGMKCSLGEQFDAWYFGEDVMLCEHLSPWWWARPELIESHRRALMAKMPEHYQPFWPHLEGKIEYWWPTHHLEER